MHAVAISLILKYNWMNYSIAIKWLANLWMDSLLPFTLARARWSCIDEKYEFYRVKINMGKFISSTWLSGL